MKIASSPRDRARRWGGMSLLTLVTAIACLWLTVNRVYLYIALIVLVIFGGGLPTFLYLRKRGYAGIFVAIVAGTILGGVAGFFSEPLSRMVGA